MSNINHKLNIEKYANKLKLEVVKIHWDSHEIKERCRVTLLDKEGYKYYLNERGLRGRIEDGIKLSIIHRGNIYSFYNIKRMAIIKFGMFVFRNEEYSGSGNNINFVDVNGFMYNIMPQDIIRRSDKHNFHKFQCNKFVEENILKIANQKFGLHVLNGYKFENMDKELFFEDLYGFRYNIIPTRISNYNKHGGNFSRFKGNKFSLFNAQKIASRFDIKILTNKFDGFEKEYDLLNTKHGYKYKQLISHMISSENAPREFGTHNPHTIFNINKYIENNDMQCKLISKNFIDSNKPLKWKCDKCGAVYKRNLHHQLRKSENNLSNGLCKNCVYYNQYGYYSIDSIKSHREYFKSNNGVVYLIKFLSDNDSFFKIGITKRKIKRRVNSIISESNAKNMKFKIISNIKSSLYECIFLEIYLHNHFKDYSYTPKEYFRGYTECFKNITKQQVQSQIDYFLSNKSQIIQQMISDHNNSDNN